MRQEDKQEFANILVDVIDAHARMKQDPNSTLPSEFHGKLKHMIDFLRNKPQYDLETYAGSALWASLSVCSEYDLHVEDIINSTVHKVHQSLYDKHSFDTLQTFTSMFSELIALTVKMNMDVMKVNPTLINEQVKRTADFLKSKDLLTRNYHLSAAFASSLLLYSEFEPDPNNIVMGAKAYLDQINKNNST